jgi:hypothetical protein
VSENTRLCWGADSRLSCVAGTPTIHAARRERGRLRTKKTTHAHRSPFGCLIRRFCSYDSEDPADEGLRSPHAVSVRAHYPSIPVSDRHRRRDARSRWAASRRPRTTARVRGHHGRVVCAPIAFANRPKRPCSRPRRVSGTSLGDRLFILYRQSCLRQHSQTVQRPHGNARLL